MELHNMNVYLSNDNAENPQSGSVEKWGPWGNKS